MMASSFLLLVRCTPSASQQPPPTRAHRIGFLTTSSPANIPDFIEAFQQGLREQGYLEGQNAVVEYRFAEGMTDRLPELAAELVRLPADVIVAMAAPAAWAAKQATESTPVVFVSVNDPVGQGLVASLAHPGGNLTGLSTLTSAVGGKRVELLKQAVPKISRLAVLWNPDNPGMVITFRETHAGASALGLEVESLEVRRPDDIPAAFEAMISTRLAFRHYAAGRAADGEGAPAL
jgi:putative ABC transport system substrate-binding protein